MPLTTINSIGSITDTIMIDEQEVRRLSDGIHRIKESIGRLPRCLLDVPEAYIARSGKVRHYDILPRYIGCTEAEEEELFDPNVYMDLFD